LKGTAVNVPERPKKVFASRSDISRSSIPLPGATLRKKGKKKKDPLGESNPHRAGRMRDKQWYCL